MLEIDLPTTIRNWAESSHTIIIARFDLPLILLTFPGLYEDMGSMFPVDPEIQGLSPKTPWFPEVLISLLVTFFLAS